EDGIRDFHVTGVQTCALPIYDLGQCGADILHAKAEVHAISAPLVHFRAGWCSSASRKSRRSTREYRAGAEPCAAGNNHSTEGREIGRAACRERLRLSVVVGAL